MSYFPRAEFIIDGRRVRWSGWLGCQLESMEWRRVPAGTEWSFTLGYGKTFHMCVFTTRRNGLRIRTTWALPAHGTIDQHNARIRELQNALRNII